MSRPNRVTRILLMLLTGLTLVVGTGTPASAQNMPGPHANVFFQNRGNGLCMEVGWSSKDAGAPVDQYPCYYGLTQNWSYNDNTGFIQNANSKLCLAWTADADFATVEQASCNQVNTQWVWNHDTGFIYPVVDQTRCLEVPWSTTAWNATLGIYRCWGGINQQWNWNDNNV